MNSFDTELFVNVLGWSLIDSLWQMGLVWLFYVIITQNGRRFSASVRYRLVLAGLFLGILCFFLQLLLNGVLSSHDHYPFSLAFKLNTPVAEFFTGYSNLVINPAFPILSLLYVLTMLVLFGRFIWHFRSQLHELTRHFQHPGSDIENIVNRLSDKIMPKRSRRVHTWISANCTCPLTVGFGKQLILLPLATVNNLTSQQLEAVIAHELFHIKRNDYILNVLVAVTEVFLFFNPFAILLAHIMRKEMENSCDDLVIHLGYDKWEYAEALYILGNKKRNGELVVLALAGSNKKVLLERVRRILNLQVPQADFLKPALLFFLCIIGVMAAESDQSQPQDITAVNTFSVSTAEQTDGQVQHLPGPIPVTTSTPPMLSGERMLAGNGQNIPRAVDENKTPISPNAPPNSSSPESYYDSIELPVQFAEDQYITAAENLQEKERVKIDTIIPAMPAYRPLYVLRKPPQQDYTLRLPPAPLVPEREVLGKTLPFVPSSTFNFREWHPADTTGKRVIDL